METSVEEDATNVIYEISTENEIICVDNDEGVKANLDNIVRKSIPKILNVEYYNKRQPEETKDKGIEKNDSKNIINNKCCFCGVFISSHMFISYIFDEKDQKELRKSKHRRNKGTAKVVCDSCLESDFKKCDEMPDVFDKSTYLIIRNNVQYFYKRKYFGKSSRNIRIMNSLNSNLSEGISDDLKVENCGNDSYHIVNIDIDDEQKEESVFYTCRICNAVLDTLPISHCLDHISTRSEGLVFPCVLCEYGYTSFQELKHHLSKTHVGNQKSLTESPPPDYSSLNLPLSRGKKSERGLKLLKELLQKQQEGRLQKEEWLDEDTGLMIKSRKDEYGDSTDSDIISIKDSESDTESGVWIIQAEDDVTTECDKDIAENVENNHEDDIEEVVFYQCNICRQEFESMEIYNGHECATEPDVVTSIVLVEDDNGSSYVQKEEVKAKVIAVTGINSITGSGVVGREIEVKGREETEEKEGSHKCQQCSKSFHTKIRLQFHVRYIHSAGADPSALRCSVCPDLVFGGEGALYDHIHFTHPRTKKYVCPVEGCNREFNIKGVLKNHMSSHSGERTHACDVCDKQFFDRQTLNEHKVTHLKVKPFQCHICNKFLNRKSRLRMHILNHQSQPSCTPILACKRCNRAFSNATTAEDHLNKLGFCTSKFDLETSDPQNISTEESVDDPDVVTLYPNDSGIELNTSAEQHADAEQMTESIGLFEDVVDKDGEESMKNDNQVSNMDENDTKCDGSNRRNELLSGLSEDAKKTIIVIEADKVFRCEYCEKIYWKQEALNLHRGEHQGQENPYTCHICGANFSTYSRRTTHKTTHGFYRGDSLNSQLDVTTLQSIRDDPFPVIKHFLCEVCNKSYLHWTYLQVHRRLKHSDDVHMYKCLTCGDEFPNSWGVAYHRKKVHRQSTGSAPAGEVPSTDVERVQYSCPDCGIILSTKAQLFLHKRSAHPTPPSPPKADLFACSRCNKRYVTKAGLQGHFKKQHEKSNSSQIHKCNECEKTFINVSGLNTHVRRVHMKEIKFVCVECGVGFYSMCDLRSHLRRHSGEKPFPCHLCGKHFRTKGMRNQHVRIHSGLRPYKCDICGVGFRRSYALQSHRLTHAPHTRSLHCPICPRMFRLKAELNTHLRHTHCVDPLTYAENQKESGANNVKNIPRTNHKEDKEQEVIIYDNNQLGIFNKDGNDINEKKSSILDVHQNSGNNVDSCLFAMYFEDGQNNFIDNIEEVQMPDTVFNQNSEEIITTEQVAHSNTMIPEGRLISQTSQLILPDESSSNNLCIITEEGSSNGEIILDTNMLQNNQYILDENDQIIGELSEESRNLIFKENPGHNRVLEVNGYLTRLVTLNGGDSDINELKLINTDNDLVNKQSMLLYGSNIVIDKVEINSGISMDDDVIDKGGAFVIDWQENEDDVASNEKSLNNCKYFSDN